MVDVPVHDGIPVRATCWVVVHVNCPDCKLELLPETDTYGRVVDNLWYCTNCKKHYGVKIEDALNARTVSEVV